MSKPELDQGLYDTVRASFARVAQQRAITLPPSFGLGWGPDVCGGPDVAGDWRSFGRAGLESFMVAVAADLGFNAPLQARAAKAFCDAMFVNTPDGWHVDPVPIERAMRDGSLARTYDQAIAPVLVQLTRPQRRQLVFFVQAVDLIAQCYVPGGNPLSTGWACSRAAMADLLNISPNPFAEWVR